MPTTITRRTTGSIDFGKFAQHNFAVFGSDTPPDSPVDGMLWLDTSLSTDHVMKYFDASPSVNDFVRMDGGGDLPNGLIVDRHVASNAAIQISKIAGLQAALDAASSDTELAAEVSRAEAAESAEATTRGNADSALSTRIDNLGTALTGSYVTLTTDQTVAGVKTFSSSPVVPAGDAPTEAVNFGQLTSVSDSLASEVTSRTNADTALGVRIDGVASDLATEVTDRGTAVTAEHDRAVTAEGTEATARAAADTTLQGNITTEASTRASADTSIRTDFASADTALGGRIDDETNAREDADGTLQDNIDAEEAARIAGDQGNATAVSNEEARATAAEGTLTTAVSAEATTRAANDTTLQNHIDAEATARTSADSTLTTNLNSEVSRATAAEGTLTSGLAAEVSRAEAAEGALSSAASTETTRVNAALALKADLVDGKLDPSQVPALGIGSVQTVATTDDRDALTNVQEGDTVIVTDDPGAGTYMRDGSGAWVELTAPSGAAAAASLAAEIAARIAGDATEASARAAAVTAEHDRAVAAEGAVATDLVTETDRAEGVESDLSDAIAAEASTARSAETTFTTNLTAEVSRATAAEGALSTAASTEHTARVAAETTLTTNLASEVTRATAAEGTLTSHLATEVTRAEAAEGDLDGRITAEVGRATDAETAEAGIRATNDDTLQTNIDAEALARGDADTAAATAAATEHTARLAAESTLQGNITAEATTRAAAVTTLTTNLASEVTNRTSADATLQSEIDALASSSTTDLSALTTRVTATEGKNTDQDGRLDVLESGASTEASARASGDNTLQLELDTLQGDSTVAGSVANAVAAETSARSTADTALSNLISAEATNRANADTVLGGLITDEATARIAADTAVRSEFASADTAIRSDFAAADSSIRTDFAAADAILQSDIDTRAVDTTVVHKAGSETVTGVKTFSAAPLVPDAATGKKAVNADQLTAAIDALSSSTTSDLSDLEGRVTDIETYDVDTAAALVTSLAGKADLVGGKVPVAQLPALALTNVTYAADTAAKDALTGMNEGDVVVVGNDGGVRASYIYNGTAWVSLSSPADVTEAELAAAVTAGLASVNDRIDGLAFGNGGTRTGDTFNVVGTADRIVANADSVDIASTYAGQSSIVTTGTITSGHWNASVIPLAYGGTGFSADDIAALVTYLNIGVTGMKGYSQKLTDMVHGTPFVVTHSLGTKNVVTSLYSDTTGEEFFGTGIIDRTTDSVTIVTDPTFPDPEDLVLVLVGVPVDDNGYSTVVAAEFIGEMGL